MRTVLFLDLDDTIFQTRPKCPAGAALRPAAYHRNGTPLCFMTETQRTPLDRLAGGATVIPTTARNLDAFRRVDLPFTHGAILDFGAVILDRDGRPDPAWDDHIRPQACAAAAELRELQQAALRCAELHRLGVQVRLIADFDMPLYLQIKHPEGDTGPLAVLAAELRALADRARFFIHLNDNNLSVVPRCLGKERAVGYFLEQRLGGERVLSIGVADSLSDAPFLALCDFSVTPRGCALARQWPRAEEL